MSDNFTAPVSCALPTLSEWLGNAASNALLFEAALAHKPGLICPQSSGPHKDMDYPLMVASAQALRPWFAHCAAAALDFGGDDPRKLFASLRQAGRRAEEEMFRVTAGVNTHKGALFALGLLAAAAALVIGNRPSAANRRISRLPGDEIRYLAAEMAGGLVAEELASGTAGAGIAVRESSGERLYRELGAQGARGQAEAGFPVVGSRILPILRRAGSAALQEETLIGALLGSMAELEDTCILSRGGVQGLETVRLGAQNVIDRGALGSPEGRRALARFDATLTGRRLSPGGSADLLAAGIFLYTIENEFSGNPAIFQKDRRGI